MSSTDDDIDDVSAQRSGIGLENRAYFERVQREVVETTARIVEALGRLEELLVLVDKVLRISQPPMPGKIGVRWWVIRGGTPIRHPVLVSWVRLTNGRWRAKAVPQVRRDRLNRQGSAALNVEETYHLAMLANRLIKAYNELHARLHAGASGLNKAYWHAAKLFPDAEALIRLSHKDVVERLLNEGYEVDVDALGLIEAAGL